MNILLKRLHGGTESTLGALYINKKFRCFTCEDEHRDEKVPGQTRIPRGRYRIKLRTAGGMHQRAKIHSWHKGMLWLQGVPGFTFIYIHIGNTHKDTAGCILVGNRAGIAAVSGGWVESSGAAYRKIYPEIAAAIEAGETVWITVEDEL